MSLICLEAPYPCLNPKKMEELIQALEGLKEAVKRLAVETEILNSHAYEAARQVGELEKLIKQ